MSVNATNLADEVRIALGFPTPTSSHLVGWASGILDELTSNGLAGFGDTFPSPYSISGLSSSSMASKIQSQVPYPFVSTELTNFCSGIIDEIHSNAVVTYSGFIPGPPVQYQFGGTISGITGSSMADKVKTAVGYPNVSAKLLAECTAICDHIINNAQVEVGVIS